MDFDEIGEPINYDYNDEYEAYNNQFNYASKYLGRNMIIESFKGPIPEGIDLTPQDRIIRRIISGIYSSKPFIIKEFRSYPKK